MMCSKLLRHNPKPGWFDRTMERALNALSGGYERLLRWVITARWTRSGGGSGGVLGWFIQARWLVLGVMGLAAWGIAAVWPTMKQELAPLEDRGTILAVVNAPDGSTLEYTNRYAQIMERMGQNYKEFDRIFGNVGNPTVSQASVIFRAVEWEKRERTIHRTANQFAAGKARFLVGQLDDLDGASANLFATASLLALFGNFSIWHQGLCPVHRTNTDSQKSEGDSETKPEVVGANGG
jgi:multidrug efflux pump subunit AcrB